MPCSKRVVALVRMGNSGLATSRQTLRYRHPSCHSPTLRGHLPFLRLLPLATLVPNIAPSQYQSLGPGAVQQKQKCSQDSNNILASYLTSRGPSVLESLIASVASSNTLHALSITSSTISFDLRSPRSNSVKVARGIAQSPRYTTILHGSSQLEQDRQRGPRSVTDWPARLWPPLAPSCSLCGRCISSAAPEAKRFGSLTAST